MKFEVEVRVVLDASPALLALLRGLAHALPLPAPDEEQDRRGQALVAPTSVGAPGPSPAVDAGTSPQVSPPLPPAVAPAAAGGARLQWSTAERDAILRREIPVNRDGAAILRMVAAASPGVPAPPTWQKVLNRAAYLKLRRPDSLQSQAAHRAMAARLAKRAQAVAAEEQDTRASLRPDLAAGPLVGEPETDPQAGGEPPAPPAPPAPSPPRLVPRLPAVNPETGKIHASYSEVRDWAGYFAIGYDGSNMDRVNKLRAAKGLPLLVQAS